MTSATLVPDLEQAVVDGRRVQIPRRDHAGAPFRSSSVRRGLLLNDQPGAELIIAPLA